MSLRKPHRRASNDEDEYDQQHDAQRHQPNHGPNFPHDPTGNHFCLHCHKANARESKQRLWNKIAETERLLKNTKDDRGTMRKDPPLTVDESRTMEQPEPPGAAEGLRGVESDERRQRVSEQERKNEEMKYELVQKGNELQLAKRELLQAEEKAQGLLQIIERNEVGEGMAKLLQKQYSQNRQLQNKVDSLSCEMKLKALETKELERRLLEEYAQHEWVYKYVGSLELRGRVADRV
ncbi:hypothetical protein N7519_010511 [Penicillium mononematosum]|uniref:uncharacterized protein n=1 Tax=Penicillium mononematosum TaxID=268346 RepID=UPI002546C6CD|nr:uncharacterized protein N7519_010511 [Penicillium mononematosum]KAJ6180050.1 hypothetical protein N7519_010511 [Penicillium mononematosum]